MKEEKYKIEEKLILISIFLLPVYIFRVNVFGFPTNWSELFLILSILVFFLGFWNERAEIAFLERKKITFLFCVIAFGMLTGLILGENTKIGLGIVKSWMIIPFLFALAAVHILRERKEKILEVYFSSAAIVGAVSIGHLLFGETTYDGRLQSIFNSPNYLAMFLGPAFLVGVFFLQGKISRMKTIFFAGGLFLISFSLYFTFSYAAWLSILAGLFPLFVHTDQKTKIKALALVFLVAALIGYFQIQSEKFQNLKNFSRSSLESRIMIWTAAEKIIKDNWIWGIGPGNFKDKYLEYQKYYPPYLEWNVPHPHNLFLAFWLYSGIWGIGAFLGLLIVWGRAVLSNQSRFKYICLGIMIYFLAHGILDTTFFKNDLAVVFWLNFLLIL